MGKVLQGSEDVSNDVQALERFGGSGAVWGKSASLACPRTLARTVELWGVRADVWEGVWRGLGVWGQSGGSGVSQNPSKDCGDVGSPSSCVLGIWGRSGCSETVQGCGTVGGPSGGLEQQPPTNSTSRLQHTAGQASGGVGSEQFLPESDLAKKKNLLFLACGGLATLARPKG